MNRRKLVTYVALLVLVLASGACSVAAGGKGDVTSDSYTQTGMLNPVVAVGERPDSMLDEVVVTAPALRSEVEEAAGRLAVPGLVEIEVSDFSPRTGLLNWRTGQMAVLRWAGGRHLPRCPQYLMTDPNRPGEER